MENAPIAVKQYEPSQRRSNREKTHFDRRVHLDRDPRHLGMCARADSSAYGRAAHRGTHAGTCSHSCAADCGAAHCSTQTDRCADSSTRANECSGS